jgi:hypothetical protein
LRPPRAEREARQSSERERRKDRRRGGQPGHPGAGLVRDPEPDERETAGPPARCSRCGTALDGAPPADPGWAQVWDVRISRRVTGWLLPAMACPCCGQVTVADAPAGLHAGTVCYGPGINTAAVPLSGYGNVPAERAARLIGMQPTTRWKRPGPEQGAKTAKRHQAVSGYWHSQRTLARWCRTRSYLDSAAAHGVTALEAVTAALSGRPWLPLPAVPAAT